MYVSIFKQNSNTVKIVIIFQPLPPFIKNEDNTFSKKSISLRNTHLFAEEYTINKTQMIYV